MSNLRIGNGFDVHAFTDGDYIVLGRTKISHPNLLKHTLKLLLAIHWVLRDLHDQQNKAGVQLHNLLLLGG